MAVNCCCNLLNCCKETSAIQYHLISQNNAKFQIIGLTSLAIVQYGQWDFEKITTLSLAIVSLTNLVAIVVACARDELNNAPIWCIRGTIERHNNLVRMLKWNEGGEERNEKSMCHSRVSNTLQDYFFPFSLLCLLLRFDANTFRCIKRLSVWHSHVVHYELSMSVGAFVDLDSRQIDKNSRCGMHPPHGRKKNDSKTFGESDWEVLCNESIEIMQAFSVGIYSKFIHFILCQYCIRKCIEMSRMQMPDHNNLRNICN